jgi:hypothetical protein
MINNFLPRVGVFIILIFISIGCEKESEVLTKNEKLVLQAYLFQNEPISGIKLSKSIPFESSDSIFTSIKDAEISIGWNGKSYPLEADTNGLYQYTKNDLQIISGETYTIKVNYDGKILSSQTKVPEKPTGLTLSSNTMSIDQDFTPFGGGSMDAGDIEISWDNPDNDYFYVVTENIEENPEDIELGFPMPGGGRPNFRFLSQPFQTDTYVLRSMMSVQQYGTHKVKVFRVNEEYAYLYENRTQDSRTLTEPYSNIENGLGIFTAFSYAEATLEVIKQK